MKRAPLAHERVFNNEDYAETYARRHKKMSEMFGREYARKLSSHGFRKGRIIDIGCGFGATNLVLLRSLSTVRLLVLICLSRSCV